MSTKLPFLNHLGLDDSADLPAIRRAYAKKLKLIDAELQPAEFQALHEVYEHAMSWAKWREALATASEQAGGVGINAAAPPPSRVSSPERQAQNIRRENQQPDFKRASAEEITGSFDAFIYRILVKCPRLPDTAGCKSELEARLKQTDLIPLEAREIFERAAAHYLAAGWKPGNDTLFVAAIDIFQWGQGKNRLDALGSVGLRLNRAVMEWAILMRQYDDGERRNIGLLARMRDDAPPTEQEMWFYNGALSRLMAQMATVLPIVTNMRNKDPWLVVPQNGVHGFRPQPPTSLPPETYKAPSGRSWGFVLACLPLAIGLAVNGLSHRNDYQIPPNRQPVHPVIITRTANPLDGRKMRVPDEMNDLQTRVVSRMQFDLKQVPPGKLPSRGLYVAMIDADGKLAEASTMQTSGNPQFDAAVIKAFHAAAPYPQNIAGKELKMQYLSLSPNDLL